MQSLFGFISHPMELGLIWLSMHLGGAGLAIILFTIGVRLVLSPLQIAQLRNAKAMQRLQPLMAELKQRHGKDRAKLQEATMALYREHNVNPAMGCLPTILQFPILIGLFYGLMHLGESPLGWPKKVLWDKVTCNNQTVGYGPHAWSTWLHQCYQTPGAAGTPQQIFNMFHANFLWLSHGLGQPDPLYILPVLAGITQWIQSRMMLTKSTDPQQQMMNTMMNFMPLMIVFFATRYASGLSLYWVTSTLIGIVIQYRITGLGLLPETLGSVAAILSGTRNQTSTLNARPAPKRVSASGGNGTGQTVQPEMNGGTSGNGSSNGTAAGKPRRKANRARGGRSGRRG